ncbi:hypothetical protein [Laspinema olomoucense]|nr:MULTISPECIES: hypothetical protein [unclassified Laspinema]MCT7970772.1 hypothetical protein [Laspinema sp. D3d]MCT7988895.1 hypothetical protein [Laspinema sp. D3a]MCT7993710.1 hypothetical protein [Laspinema sp. D3c]
MDCQETRLSFLYCTEALGEGILNWQWLDDSPVGARRSPSCNSDDF